MTEQPGQVTSGRIMQLAFAPSLIIAAALKHGVFDLLDAGPRTAEEISAATGASIRGLRAILNALTALELLTKQAVDRYALVPESAAFLVSSKPGFHGGFFQRAGKQLLPKWMALDEIVCTGKPIIGVSEKMDDEASLADSVMSRFTMSYPAARTLGEALAVAQAGQLVNVLDIGAGSGVWGIALAQQSPQVEVTAVDRAAVIGVTQQAATRYGVGDRCRYIEGDMHEVDFGTGYQIVTLGYILHAEGETKSRALLKKVFGALAPGGTVAIADILANADRTGPPFAMLFAVNVLVHTEEGDLFSFKEISGWLREAGFVEPRLLEIPGPSPMVLATKP